MRYAAVGLAVMLGITSCDAPGRRSREGRVIRPTELTNFALLFSQNCSGCHGKDGQGALTVGIGTPVYLAIAGDAAIRGTIESGRSGTSMPAFAQKAGGMLTAAQIESLVRGIRNWAKPVAENPPAYASSRPGDPSRGQDVFAVSCASCHGKDGRGAMAITEPSYLSLVTD